MSTELIVSAVVNIAVALAINALFPPPDIVQEGPRLNDLEITSASYGRPINVMFGTDRVSGNVIWGQPIEEVRTEESRGGKGKGGEVKNVTYTYFATFAVSFATNGAEDVLRLWADGKLIFDKTGTGDTFKAGLNFTFYPGGANQQRDPLEEADIGTADTPAYRHLSRIVFNRLPLADFGRRIPNITAELTFNATSNFPVVKIIEETVPGVIGVSSRSAVDHRNNSLFGLAEDLGVDTYRANRDTGILEATLLAISPATQTGYGWDLLLATDGASNFVPIKRFNAITMKEVGESSFTTANGNQSYLILHKVGNSQVGEVMIGVIGGDSIIDNRWSIFIARQSGFIIGDEQGNPLTDGFQFLEEITPAGGTPITDEVNITIPDDERGSDSQNMYVVSVNGSQTRVAKVAFTFWPATFQTTFNQLFDVIQIGAELIEQTAGIEREPEIDFDYTIETLSDFTFPAGDAVPRGWVVDGSTGRLVISNGTSAVLYDPESTSVIAQNSGVGFEGWYNYANRGVFGYAAGSSSSGAVRIVSLTDLSILSTNSVSDFGLTGSNAIEEETSVWDDEGQAVMFSRIGAAPAPSANERVVRVLMNRGNGLGVTLESVITALMTQYNDLPMADLPVGSFDTSTLAGITVEGYNIDRASTIRDAIDPLRQAFFFDVVQSDWGLKFPVRGGAAVLTIPQERVGQAQFNAEGSNVPIEETRTQEESLPMRLNMRYVDRDMLYDKNVEHAKRILQPSPAMHSKEEKTIDLPIVFEGGDIPKQAVEKWLYTLWNERLNYKTIIPWDYLKLDPGDVINVGMFDETIRLRITEQDVGVGLLTEIGGAQEAAYTFSSTLQSGVPLGVPVQTVASSAPTKIIFLDAPLLTFGDLNQGQSSAAYAAMGSYQANWPGAVAYISNNGQNFEARATSTAEMAWGFVVTPPSPWGEEDDCGDFPNVFQEVADGGTMLIQVQRRTDDFNSATELTVLNGANVIAVNTLYGTEIIQFQDISVPDSDKPNELLLSRLLRGRLGTEDITVRNGLTGGDEFVLITDEVFENDVITRFDIPLEELGKLQAFRAVTISTNLEDADTRYFRYTGRDLRPYTPAHIEYTLATDLDVTWERRTRINGGWQDGTGEVPLVESLEKYEAILTNDLSDDIKLACPFGGPDNAQTAIDASNTGRTLTFGSTAKISTEEFKFGSSSLELSGTVGDPSTSFVSAADSTDFEFGAGQFTLDCFVRFKDLTDSFQVIMSKYNSGSNERSFFVARNGANLQFTFYTDGSAASAVTFSGTWTGLTVDTWYHVAVDRDASDVVRVYLDGAVVASGTDGSTLFGGTANFYLGKLRDSGGGGDDPLNGYIDDAIVFKGTAFYGGAFTPRTAAFPLGTGLVAKEILNEKTVTFTAAEMALALGQPLKVEVRQVGGTGIRSPAASCLIV